MVTDPETAADQDRQGLADRLRVELPTSRDEAVSVQELQLRLSVPATSIRSALDTLGDQVTRTGPGTRGNPRRFFKTTTMAKPLGFDRRSHHPHPDTKETDPKWQTDDRAPPEAENDTPLPEPK